jgi:hypothetical protein
LMGDAKWVVGETTDDAPTLQGSLNWIKQYQKSAPANARFAGIHMDVEPWGLDDWARNKKAYVNSLVKIVDTVVAFAKSQNLRVAIDLPFWANTVACKGSTLDKCFLGTLDSVTYMTYRNTAPNLIDVAAPLLKAVANAQSKTTVWLAVETSPDCAEPELISYAVKGKKALMNDLATVEKYAAKKASGFAGITVHSYKEFTTLKL